ncbi:MAG: hypothetical protein QOG03_2014 [Actinomycetota bacterium]|nr:hypothetical protein [Actinomycetota bacterium]
MTRGPGRLVLAVVLIAAAVLSEPAAVVAHEEVPGVRNVLDGVEPSVPGVTVQVRISAADQLVVANTTATDLDVLGAAGELFLRIGPGGVLANLNSPTWYLSLNPEGGTVPAGVDAHAAPRFGRVSTEPSWGWFDHRLHPTLLARPPATNGQRVVPLSSWQVDMRYGGRAIVVRGHREYRAIAGAFRTTILTQARGTQATTLPGRLPGIFFRLSGARQVTLLGEGGEPFARIGPSGAEVNEASPTWAITAATRGSFSPSGAVDPAAAPRWRHESVQAQLTWLEPRARFARDEPTAPERAAVLVFWTVPVTVDGAADKITGTTSWVPAAAHQPVPAARARGGVARWLLIAMVAAAGALVLLVVLLRRRQWSSSR